jgi:hypothetical protein
MNLHVVIWAGPHIKSFKLHWEKCIFTWIIIIFEGSGIKKADSTTIRESHALQATL